ncbi:MAG: Fur family transcriptional regulator [Anaerolineales bacterium]
MLNTTPGTYNQWIDSLSESGYRVTAPRRAIIEIMAGSPRALGPLEIYDQGRKEYPGLGLVTVYRTLEKLEELGLIERVHHPQGCHMYLRAADGHEHLVLCTACGKAEYFSGDDISKLMNAVAEKTGFEIREHWLQLFGLCSDCKKQN